MKLIGSRRAVRSPEFHKKMEFRRKFRVFIFSIFFSLLLVSPIYILRSENFLVAKVSITGNKVTQTEEIESLVWGGISGEYLKIIPKSSIVFYPKESLRKVLSESIPRLASVNFSITSSKSIEVSVVEREPVALYCIDSEEKKCFFVDKTGLVYSEAANFSEGVYVVYKSVPEISSPLRTYFLSEVEIARNASFLNNLSKINWIPDSLTKDDEAYTLKLKDGPKVFFRAEQDFGRLFLDLEAFLKSAKIKPANFSQISYFDLRVDNKIFYKFLSE